jgi:5-methylcytosine-specific restriction endonuclease McrA
VATRPCIEHRCPNYALPGKSRCEQHHTEFEARRRADPDLTGRRGTDPAWRRARLGCLARHRYTCQRCGRTKVELARLDKRLHVHHKDGDATNHDQANLEPLCDAGCHQQAQRELELGIAL